MSRSASRVRVMAVGMCFVVSGIAYGQADQVPAEPVGRPAQQAAAPVASDPAAPRAAAPQPSDVTAQAAKVVEVSGDVKQAPTGTSPLATEAWSAVKQDDELPPGTLIRTGLRSQVTLLFGDNTVVQVRRMTLASISEFYSSATQETIRLGLGYGAVRGGAAEGTLRSDLVIDSTVATLAKRGTEGFEMEVEAHTGRFRISLAEEGLVEALQKLTGQRRLVRPGQYTTNMSIAKTWVNQAKFDRAVQLVSYDGLSKSDLAFTVNNQRGLGSVSPGAGTEVVAFSGRGNQASATAAGTGPAFAAPSLPDTVVIERGPVQRPEGNFGIRRALRVLVPAD